MGCIYCNRKIGKEFNLKKSPVSIETQPDRAFIIQGNNEEAGIILLKNGLAQGCFDISYCPFCGRKLEIICEKENEYEEFMY